MAKGGMQFLINSSYTMDDEVVDDDDPPAAPPPQSKDENKAVPSSPPSPAEEKKSDNNSIVDSGEVTGGGGGKQQSQEIIIDAETTTKTAEAASMITPQSSNLHDDQSSSQIIIEDSSKIAAAAIETSDELPIKSTMAMVKLRVWDPAAPSQQFKCISATTVLLLPRDSRCNNSDSVDTDDNDLANDANYMNLVTTSNKKYRDDRNQKRLSVVEEERRTVSGRSILCDDENNDNSTDATSASDVNVDSSLLDDCHHAILNGAESQRQQERRETVKIANKSVKNNLSQLVEENVNDDDDDDTNNNILQVGNLVGIHLIKKKPPSSLSSATNTSAASSVVSDNARNNKQQEWKVGNSIRVLHNLNLLPLHTAGLERLLYQIEHNDPSLRELILDGITTTLSTKHLEILIEAIGKNTSIKKCSLQHSQITNEIASTLALALVDNTTLTTLSLRGNDLTNVAVKNFYSVLSSGNRSLRVLDITNNPRIEVDIREAFETFMEQRAVKRMLTLRAEKAKRIAKGMPLLNEMLEEESEEDWRIGSGDGRRRSVNGSFGGVTVVCHPDIIDGTFHNNAPGNNFEAVPQLQQSSSTGNSFDTYQQSEGSGSRPDEEVRGCYDSVLSDITGVTGVGNESRAASPRESRSAFDSPSPQQQQQRQQQQASYLSQSIGSELYPHSQQQQEEEQKPMPMSSPQRSVRHFDPNYSMASSQISSNDSSTSNTGIESLDQRQRQQLATLNGNNNNSSSRRNSNNFRSSNTSSRNSLQVSAEDYFDPKATERELRRQLATQGQAIGAYAIDDEAPHRQEVRGRRARVSRTESQRRARLLELSGSAPPSAGGGAVNTDVEGGGVNLVDADIERIEDYEYRNLSLYRKFFYKIGLDGDDNKTERVICLTFGVCILVLLVAIILYVAEG